ncbi:MAG TPA: class I SAM-dependent methyltransferase [Deltaproteobacteria bacterium]|nr:class I SAM-dependent methyltransferase [Deltaproteobacteria bacterium]
MVEKNLYSTDDIAGTYRAVADHIDTRHHIFRYSENHRDVRDVALQGIDLGWVRSALDLGCAYGFFTEKIVTCLHMNAHITGIDLIDDGNRSSFLSIVESAGRRGCFIAGHADCIREMKSGKFDLVIASYSLYFFPHLIREIARILQPRGVFIAVTHTERSLNEIIQLIPGAMKQTGIEPPGELAISRLLQVFSMENGERRLAPHFKTVEIIPYPNKLIFPRERIDDCIDYLSKKRNLLFKEVIERDRNRLQDVMEVFFSGLRERAEHGAVLEITKHDCIFRCRYPKAE